VKYFGRIAPQTNHYGYLRLGKAPWNVSALDQYKRLLLAKRRELMAVTVGTLSDAGGVEARPGDPPDRATEETEITFRPVCARATVICSEQSKRHWPESRKALLACVIAASVLSPKPG